MEQYPFSPFSIIVERQSSHSVGVGLHSCINGVFKIIDVADQVECYVFNRPSFGGWDFRIILLSVILKLSEEW